MTAPTNDERFQRYVEAIRDEVDHGDVTCADAARAVIGMADTELDEQEGRANYWERKAETYRRQIVELRRESEIQVGFGRLWLERAEAAEAKVAKIEALADGADWKPLGGRIVVPLDEIRAALAGADRPRP